MNKYEIQQEGCSRSETNDIIVLFIYFVVSLLLIPTSLYLKAACSDCILPLSLLCILFVYASCLSAILRKSCQMFRLFTFTLNLHLSLNRVGCWCITDDFTTSFLPILFCSPLPSGTWQTPGLSIP